MYLQQQLKQLKHREKWPQSLPNLQLQHNTDFPIVVVMVAAIQAPTVAHTTEIVCSGVISRTIHTGRQINPSQICTNTNVFQSRMIWRTVTFAAVTPSCCEQISCGL